MLKPPWEALEICAHDLGVDDTEIRMLPGPIDGRYYKSDVFFVGTEASESPFFVVKVVDAAPYAPKHELEALEFAASLLGADAEKPVDGLGVVSPVGWGTNFLVTRYQAGELANVAMDGAVLGWRRPRPLAEAHDQARLMAHWLGEFRARGAREDGGLEPSAYLDAIIERADAFRKALGADVLRVGAQMDRLLRHVEGYMGQLDGDDVARMRRVYPNRGDARPKNFLVGDDGVLYALDMEGFGFGPMEHDISCFHHALEYDGVRSPSASRRASALWRSFWDKYAQHGSSPSFALLGYLYFILDRMRKSANSAAGSGLRRQLRMQIWLLSRLRWLSRLTGDLAADVDRMRRVV